MSKWKVCIKCKKTRPVEDFKGSSFICKDCIGK